MISTPVKMVLNESNMYLQQQQDYQNLSIGHHNHIYGNTGANNNQHQQYPSTGGNHINKQIGYSHQLQQFGQSHSQPQQQQPQYVKVNKLCYKLCINLTTSNANYLCI